VESAFGGYGLYYRSPMAEIGLVARAGTLLGEVPIPVDVLYDTERARRLVDTFTEAVAGTDYVQQWMFTTDPLPAKVLEDFAEVACLCQLRVRPDERDAVHAALFGIDEHSSGATTTGAGSTVEEDAEFAPTLVLDAEAAVTQRRRSVAHYLTLIGAEPDVVDNESAYREALWGSSGDRSDAHATVAGQWAGLVAKDVWQDSLCSTWAEFTRAGLAATHASETDGLTWEETRELARSLTAGPPSVDSTRPTTDLAQAVAAGTMRLAGIDSPLPEATLEQLRHATVEASSATSGLVVLLELHRRAADRSGPGWTQTSGVRSAWQPSLAEVLTSLGAHLQENPTVADTLWWLVQRFIISVHERIAYSKLPEDTFRFRWEDGRVRFYDNGVGRFRLAAIRFAPLSLLTWDLRFWDKGDEGSKLTQRGESFVGEVLG